MIKKPQLPATKKDVAKEIVKLKFNNPNMSLSEIGQIVGRHKSNVMRCLREHEIDTKRVDSFRRMRADLLSSAQSEMLDNINPEKMEKASLKDLSIAFSILYDKERLETGKSTQNLALSKIVEMVDKD